MSGMSPETQKALADLHPILQVRLEGRFLLLTFEDHGDQGFRVWSGVGDSVSVAQVEGGIHDLLRQLVAHEAGRTDNCVVCPSCQSRRRRAMAALAALELGGMTATPAPAVQH